MNSFFKLLGPLRLGLLGLVVVDILVHAGWLLIGATADIDTEFTGWQAVPAMVSPVLAPILIVVLLFDVIMSKVQAADDPEAKSTRYRLIARIDLTFIGLMLLYWIPFFITLQSTR